MENERRYRRLRTAAPGENTRRSGITTAASPPCRPSTSLAVYAGKTEGATRKVEAVQCWQVAEVWR